MYYLGPLLCFLQRRVTTIRSPCCHFLTLCSRRKAAAISVYISEYGGARTDGAERNGPRTMPTAHDQVLLEPKSGREAQHAGTASQCLKRGQLRVLFRANVVSASLLYKQGWGGGVILLAEFLQQRAAFVSTSEKQKEVSRREI